MNGLRRNDIATRTFAGIPFFVLKSLFLLVYFYEHLNRERFKKYFLTVHPFLPVSRLTTYKNA